MSLSIIFCGKCASNLVDSGFETETTLKCVDCSNSKDFKIGKISLGDDEEKILALAKQDAML
ncbi:hypothetical protein WD019_13635 [Fictibacillus sp. Mic-4]|uniref:hypothetical protein n=1 Tax=Fictibacillus sp. Mic-4 TaxID=3132826 RepID=UPI003CEA5579